MKKVLIPYIGGKYYLKDWIIPKLDYSKRTYVELFGGGASILINKPPHKVEIYNDIDGDLVNLFNVVKNNFDKFEKELEWELISEENFYKYLKELNETKDLEPVKRAVRYYYLLRLSFNGNLRSFGLGLSRNKIITENLDILKAIHKRLQKVYIVNKNFRDLLNSIVDKDFCMIYADPPYYGLKHYKNSFDENDHLELANLLNRCKGSVMISYYYFDGIYDLYPKDKWIYLEKEIAKFSYGITKNSKSTSRPVGKELLILNYEPKEQNK